jgi:cation:H+ antiporter
MPAMAGFTKNDLLQMAALSAAFLPMLLVLAFGLGGNSPVLVAVATGVGIAAAGFALAWGVESLQFVVSQVLALAVLALVQVMPEYSVEVVLAYRGAFDPVILHYATASMTGANRLLLGLGWPVVYFLNYAANRKQGAGAARGLVLKGDQSVEVLFLGVATAYSFLIVLKGTLGPFDAFVLGAVFAAYLYIAKRLPPRREEDAPELEGPARAVLSLGGARRGAAMGVLVILGGLAIYFGSEPFVSSMLSLGAQLNLNEYLLVQWLAPVLTELPEAVTVFFWASKTGKGGLALANLVSSKLNQWTLLLGTIPVVFAIGAGGLQSIVLTPLQSEELLLTAAQSLFGFVCLLDLRLSGREAGLLALLFTAQFVFPPIRVEVAAAYLLLSGIEVVRVKGRFYVLEHVSALLKVSRA